MTSLASKMRPSFGSASRRRGGVVSLCGAWLGVLPDKWVGESQFVIG